MKRWTRLAAVTAAAALTMGLAAPVASAEEGPASGLPRGARLSCAGSIVDGAPVAACRWNVGVTDYSGVELWRGTGENGELTRVKVFETADAAVKTARDTTIEVGTRYGYVLVVLGPEGNPRAVSNLSIVGVAPPAERLQLVCRRAAERTIHCEWNAPQHPGAAKVTLWAIVDRGSRQALTTVEPAGAGSFDFVVPNGATAVRMALVSYNEAGNVVGRSPLLLFQVGRPRR